jgi:hypothetical protein
MHARIPFSAGARAPNNNHQLRARWLRYGQNSHLAKEQRERKAQIWGRTIARVFLAIHYY